jgi:hypothetical protein
MLSSSVHKPVAEIEPLPVETEDKEKTCLEAGKEGEEKEDTLFEAIVLLREFVPEAEDPKDKWKKVGRGLIRINQDKADSTKLRLLLRSEGIGHVLLNSKIFKGQTVDTKGTKDVTFSAVKKTGLRTFNARFLGKPEGSAAKFAEKLREAIKKV